MTEPTVAALNKKVCMLGEFSVGKTSLVQRFVFERFDDRYLSTVGVKVSRKTLAIPCDETVVYLTMMLWDLAGSENFDRVRTSYLRGSAGAILVCDLTRPHTLAQLSTYVEHLAALDLHIPMVLAANKADLDAERTVDDAALMDVAQSLDVSFCLTSAKRGDEVETLFRELGRLLLRT